MTADIRAPVRSQRAVLALAVPIALSNLSVPLVGLVDTAVMGRMPTPDFIGAVALGAVVFSFLFWGFGFLRMGTTGLVAQAFGRGDGTAVRDLVARNLLLAAALGGVLLLVQWPVGELARTLMPASEAVEASMATYYRVRIWSAPAVLANYVLMGVFVGARRTGFALVSQLVLNLCNAGLSALFVLGFGWGVAGVAAASVLGEYAALACGLALLRPALAGTPGAWDFRAALTFDGYRPLVAVNANIFVRTLCLIFAFAWFNAQAAAMGDVVLAVNAVLLQMVNLLSYGLDGFAHAAETLVGSAVGARRRDDCRWAVRATTAWAALTALGYSVAYAAFGGSVVGMLTTLEAVRQQAAEYTVWMVLIPLAAVWSYQLDGIFVGALRTAAMRDAMIVSLAVFLATSVAAVRLAGNHGLWFALVVFFVVRAVTLLVRLRRAPLVVPESASDATTLA